MYIFYLIVLLYKHIWENIMHFPIYVLRIIYLS